MASLWLLIAVVSSVLGMGWLALAMDVHWKQVRASSLSAASATRLRCLGGSFLLLSLCTCLAADHASMAALVWVMLLAVAALAIALVLAWRPRLLAPLAIAVPKAER